MKSHIQLTLKTAVVKLHGQNKQFPTTNEYITSAAIGLSKSPLIKPCISSASKQCLDAPLGFNEWKEVVTSAGLFCGCPWIDFHMVHTASSTSFYKNTKKQSKVVLLNNSLTLILLLYNHECYSCVAMPAR